MGISDRLPGMRPGHRVRNIAVGIGYFFLAMMILGALSGDAPDNDDEADLEGDESAEAQEETGDEETEAEDEVDEADVDETEMEDDEAESDPPEAEDEDEVEDDEVATDGGTATEAPEQDDGASEIEAEDDDTTATPQMMELVINDEGIDADVSEADAGDQSLVIVDYRSDAQTEEQLAYDLGYIAGTYAYIVDDGYDTLALHIELQQPDGTPVGLYALDAETAQAYMDGEISDEEFSMELLGSFEPY